MFCLILALALRLQRQGFGLSGAKLEELRLGSLVVPGFGMLGLRIQVYGFGLGGTLNPKPSAPKP